MILKDIIVYDTDTDDPERQYSPKGKRSRSSPSPLIKKGITKNSHKGHLLDACIRNHIICLYV